MYACTLSECLTKATEGTCESSSPSPTQLLLLAFKAQCYEISGTERPCLLTGPDVAAEDQQDDTGDENLLAAGGFMLTITYQDPPYQISE